MPVFENDRSAREAASTHLAAKALSASRLALLRQRRISGRAGDAYVFLTPMLLLAAAVSLGAAVLMLHDKPAEQTAAERAKCAREERPTCPTS